MSRRYRRRRGSTAGQLVSDTAFIANRLPWPWQLAFGFFLFASFYWGVPAVIAWQLDSIENKIVREFSREPSDAEDIGPNCWVSR